MATSGSTTNTTTSTGSGPVAAYQNSVYTLGNQMNCVQCHGVVPEGEANPVTGGGITQSPGWLVTDVNDAYANAKAFANFANPAASVLVTFAGNNHCGITAICGNGSILMQQAIATWAAAENAAGTAGQTGQITNSSLVSDEQTLTLIQSDLMAQPVADQPYYRYFTLESYGNYNGRGTQVLPARAFSAIIKAVNLSSMGPAIELPTKIDANGLILRWDARTLNWTAPQAVATWANLKGMDPYFSPADYPTSLSNAANQTLRADWFLSNLAGSSVGAYFGLLGVNANNPNGGYFSLLNEKSDGTTNTDRAQIDLLNGVNNFGDMDTGAPATYRSALYLSGTEMFYRIISWHATNTFGTGAAGSGHLFRSYNMDNDLGTEDMYSHPYQPLEENPAPTGADSAYYWTAGDSDNMQSLPNGLFLNYTVEQEGANGGTTPGQLQTVANSGATYPGPTFCYQCHDGPSIQFQDTMHAAILADPEGTFPAALTPILLGIYNQTQMAAEQTAAMASYHTAFAKLNLTTTEAPGIATESMNILTTNYVEVVDIWMAAAELGVTPAQVITAINSSTTLSSDLGGLLTVDANGNPNGKIRREDWEADYQLVRKILFPASFPSPTPTPKPSPSPTPKPSPSPTPKPKG